MYNGCPAVNISGTYSASSTGENKRIAVNTPAVSTVHGWQGGATRTAKARAGCTGLSASVAEKNSLSRGLRQRSSRRLRRGGLGSRLRGERPNQRHNPANERPSREEV